MAKYIDADKAIEVIINTPSMVGSKYDFDHDVLTALVDKEHEIIDLINNNVPTAVVAPVTHAHWIKDDNNQCYCSACMDDHHRPMFFTPHPQWKYCPWCGAKMDEKEEV